MDPASVPGDHARERMSLLGSGRGAAADLGARSAPVVLASAVLLLMALSLLLANPAHAQDDDDDDDDFVNGEVVVKLDPASGVTVEQINTEYGTETEDTFLGSASIYLLRVTDGEDAEAKAEQMENDPQRRVLYAEPNFVTEAPEGDGRWRARSDSAPVPSSDPVLYSEQYAVGALNLECAQGIGRGAGTVVAVLDTGVQQDHPILAGSLAPGYDFIEDLNDTNGPADEPNGLDDDGDSYVDETTGHGTHVAGLVHLVAPEAKIMPLRVLDSDGRGNVFVIAEAVQYAVRNGADVINMSLGSSQESELLGDVTETLAKDDDDDGDDDDGDDDDGDAIGGVPAEGVVVAASAGNGDTNAEQYPAAGDGVLAVTSVNQEGKKSEWANYGTGTSGWVDVAAPGEDVYSAFPTSRYALWDGTSMAAPFVAGQAAVIRGLEPTMPVEAAPGEPSVEGTIESTARPLEDATLGAGHADVGASVQDLRPGAGCASLPPPPNTAPSIIDASPAPGSITRILTPTVSATVRDAETNLTKDNITLSLNGRAIANFSYDASTDRLTYTTSKLLYRATHTVKLTATDPQGASETETWSFRVVRR